MSTLVWRLPHAGRWTLICGPARVVQRVSRAVRNRRTLRLLALGYLVKSLVFAAAWYAVPDLPQRIYGSLQTVLQLVTR